MIPQAAYTASQLIVHLSEASLGILKSCLCAPNTSLQYGKFAWLLNCLPKTKTPCKEVPVIQIENLPTNWLDHINVPNTRWVSEHHPLNTQEWKQSYISAESFLSNKHGLGVPQRSQFSPFYCQRMDFKRKSYLQYVQIRSFISVGKMEEWKMEELKDLEDKAKQQPRNPKVQAKYLQAIINKDPELVIRWYESDHCATDDVKVKDIYNKAKAAQSGNKLFQNIFENNRGTEAEPFVVVMKENMKKGRGKGRLLSLIITCGFMYYFIKEMSPSRMIGKDFFPDESEKKVRFDDVQGCDEAKEELQEVVQFLQNPEKFERLGAKIPCGVLLIGSPGTGKTLLARAIAGEANVPFFFVSGSEFDEMFVGVGAKRIRKLFASAKEYSPSIIFIDELDAIGGARVANDVQPYSRMTLNQLLVELDGFDQSQGVIVIGATNFPEVLDKALTRPGRFDSKVHVSLPDIRGRTNILKLYINKSNCADDVDEEVIARATPGFTGADLSNLANQAALRAAVLQLPLITMEQFEWARDKITMGPERRSAVIPKENQILTAYHEGGHAIVALYTKDAQSPHKATIMPRGDALGYVLLLPERDELSISRKQLLARMDVCMGGRVAEEVIFGEDSITTGASSDMEQASKIARAMVTKYGMSEKVGTVLIDERQDKISPELQNIIESEVKRLIQEAYVRAKNILQKHSKEHKRLAEGLLKYETLNSNEIDLIIKGKPLQNK